MQPFALLLFFLFVNSKIVIRQVQNESKGHSSKKTRHSSKLLTTKICSKYMFLPLF